MAARIAAHRARRPASWATVEVGPDLPEVLRRLDGVALVDSLGTWVAGHADLAPDGTALCAALRDREAAGAGDTVVVSEEVGLGVHAATEAGRRFADVLGDLNRAVADLADRALLVVAGRVLPRDRPAGRACCGRRSGSSPPAAGPRRPMPGPGPGSASWGPSSGSRWAAPGGWPASCGRRSSPRSSRWRSTPP